MEKFGIKEEAKETTACGESVVSTDNFQTELMRIQALPLSPRSKKREINKLYCKNNRRKNKEYTKELESKIEFLEEKVEKLTQQLGEYRYKLNIMAIGGEKDYGDFKLLQTMQREDLVSA